MTAVLKANSAADFLAMVPTLAGFQPHDSVVCVMFTGKRTSGAMRFDLPAESEESHYRSLAAMLVGQLGNVHGIDRVAPVIYTSSTFADEHGMPWRDLMSVLRRRIKDAGYGLTEALCVAADGWGSYLDRSTPREGRPLEDVTQSPLNDLPELRHDLQDLRELRELPPASRERVRELRRALAAIGRCTTDAELAAVVGIDAEGDGLFPVELVERCLDSTEPIPPATAAWLLELLQSPAIRDAAMLQIAFGRRAGEETEASNEYYAAIQRRTGQTLDEIVLEDIEAGNSTPGTPWDAAIIGERAQPPDTDRIRAGIRVLRDLIAHAPEARQPAPLCMLAWLTWCLGISSVANHHVESALRIDPDYGMARTLWSLFASGKLPRWAFESIRDVHSSVQEAL